MKHDVYEDLADCCLMVGIVLLVMFGFYAVGQVLERIADTVLQ